MSPPPEQSSELREHDWDDLEVDGIPVGEGFGVSIEPDNEQHAILPLEPQVATVPMRYHRLWLTKRDNRGDYLKLREISPLCVVTARKGARRIVFDQGRLR